MHLVVFWRELIMFFWESSGDEDIIKRGALLERCGEGGMNGICGLFLFRLWWCEKSIRLICMCGGGFFLF